MLSKSNSLHSQKFPRQKWLFASLVAGIRLKEPNGNRALKVSDMDTSTSTTKLARVQALLAAWGIFRD